MRSQKLQIIYEDREIIAVDKPAGLLTIATASEKTRTLYHQVSGYVKKESGPRHMIFIVHRLDRETSGVIVFAKHYDTKIALQDLFASDDIVRHYQAVVTGLPAHTRGQVIQYLVQDGFGNVFAAGSHSRAAKKAVTDYQVLAERNGLALIEAVIHTGRKNQIRLAMQSLGCPILGDTKFGGRRAKRMYLNASELDLRAFDGRPAYLLKSNIVFADIGF